MENGATLTIMMLSRRKRSCNRYDKVTKHSHHAGNSGPKETLGFPWRSGLIGHGSFGSAQYIHIVLVCLHGSEPQVGDLRIPLKGGGQLELGGTTEAFPLTTLSSSDKAQ